MNFYIDSQIVVQTAAQWAVDATVYSAKRILITSDAYYGTSTTRKIKIANGVDIYNSLAFLLEETDDLLVTGTLGVSSSLIAYTSNTISLTASSDNLSIGNETIIVLDANGNYNLTGIAGGSDGLIKILYNTDPTNTITLKNNTTSSIGNRFDFYPAVDFVLNPKQFVILIYTHNRWKILRESIASSTVTGLLSSTDWNTFNGKQDALVSGTNIKTINGVTILGSGDLSVGGGGSGALNNLTYSGNYRPHKNIIAGSISSTTGYSGVVLYQKITPAIDMTVTALCAICTTGSASQTCRMALYTSTTGVGQLPDALISGTDTGNLDCTSTGLKEGSITATALLANTDYWIFFEVSNASVGFRNIQVCEMDIYSTADNLYHSNIRKSSSYITPPASAGSGFTYSTPNSALNVLHYLKIQ